MNEKELIKSFMDDCSQRLSKYTIKNHKTTLRTLKEFLGDINTVYATKIDIRRYLNDLKIRKRSRSTIEGRLNSLKSFYEYLRTFHDIDTVNLDDINIMDYPKSRWEGFGTDALSRKEVRALIDAANSIRNTLIIAILYFCGLRANEISNLKLEDINTKERTFSVIGKGDKPRTVPYASALDRIIDQWLKKERRSYVNQDGAYFFPSKHGKMLTTNAVYRIVFKNAVKAGIQKEIGRRGDGSVIYKVHPHTLRHSYATHLIEDDVPINHVQQYMGHSQITTTIKYTTNRGLFKSYHNNFKGI